MIVSNQDRRLTFNNAKELCKANGINVDKASPAYSYLRLETPILDGQTQFTFVVQDNQTYNGYNQSPTEKRLALQDNFVVGTKAFYLLFYDTRFNRPASQLLTYIGPWNTPDDYLYGQLNSILTGLPTGIINGLNGEWWRSGWMRYSMDYKVIIPRYDMLQHYYVPQTQQQFLTKVNTSDPADSWPYPYTMDQADGLSDGWIPMEPNIVMSGAKNNEINMFMPFAMPFSAAGLNWVNPSITDGTIVPKLCVMYRGVLLQNTTNVK